MIVTDEDLFSSREFAFTIEDFNYLRSIITSKIGISVSDSKREMFYSRLTRRLRALGMSNFEQYCDLLKKDDSGVEITELVNAITTNLTSFFREAHHFDFLTNTLIPQYMEENPNQKLRFWSAGCSTGEEPYSIAMTICESPLARQLGNVELMATDVDSNVLARAGKGEYSSDRVSEMDYQMMKRWFLRGKGSNAGMVKVKPELQRMVKLSQLNLVSEWTLPQPVEVVFCRNVIIYFDKSTKKAIIERIANNMTPGGYLFLGHSESLFRVSERFESLGNTIYRKLY